MFLSFYHSALLAFTLQKVNSSLEDVMVNGTQSTIIRKEFRATVRATWPKPEADRIIAEAQRRSYDEAYCFDIYEKAMAV